MFFRPKNFKLQMIGKKSITTTKKMIRANKIKRFLFLSTFGGGGGGIVRKAFRLFGSLTAKSLTTRNIQIISYLNIDHSPIVQRQFSFIVNTLCVINLEYL